MNKLFIALPILTLLSIGAVLLIANNKTVSQETNDVTISQWKACQNSVPYHACEDLTDANLRQTCYSASSANANLTWPDAAGELPACKSFYAYFNSSQAAYLLNYNNYYQNCFLDSTALNAAKSSDYYYAAIYGPKWVICAGF